MAVRVAIDHVTAYRYDRPVHLSPHLIRLRPAPHARTPSHDHRLEVDPAPAVVSEREDFFGNSVTYFSLESAHSDLRVTATTELKVQGTSGERHDQSNAFWEETAARVCEELTPANLDARQYLLESQMVALFPELQDYAAISFPEGRPVVDAVRDLMQRIYADFTFDPGFSNVATPLVDVFEHRRGVCQDFAHLAIACLRARGQPARYVSGYLETVPAPGEEKLLGSDASHAWFSVYDPDLGWLDFDATNNQIPMDRYITTAWGRDYADVAPLKGVIFGGGDHGTAVAVDVLRLD